MSDPVSGISKSASALRYWERRQEVVSNNLANVSTAGFKAERVFGRLVAGSSTVPDTATDIRGGTLHPTGNPLDLALDGQGFFVVSSPNGERLTRGGSFKLDEQGRIIDANGNALIDENGGPIIVHNGTLEIDKQGAVKVDGQPVGKLRLEALPAGTKLVHEGSNLFVPAAARTPLSPDALAVRQGAIEDSNVDSVGSMVDMIAVQRAYASVMKSVSTLDDVRRVIANDLGKV